jgi:hypothetical protein
VRGRLLQTSLRLEYAPARIESGLSSSEALYLAKPAAHATVLTSFGCIDELTRV